MRVSLLALFSLVVPLLAHAQTIATGTLVGADARPMTTAHVHLKKSSSQRESIVSVRCDRDGRFRLPIDKPGIYVLEFSGIDHQACHIPLIAISRDPIALDVRLAANNLPMNPDEVLIIGDFNKWSFREPGTMSRKKDGTFAYTVKAVDDSLVYQLVFSIGEGDKAAVRSVNGTDAHHHTYDGGGDYHSVVRAREGRRVTIAFDPRLSARSDSSVQVSYGDTSSMQAHYHAMTVARAARQERFYRAMKERIESGNDDDDLPFAADAEIASALRNIDEESDPVLRSVAMVHYFTMKAPHHDSAMARRALREIDATSPVWEIDAAALIVATGAAGDDEFYEKVLAHHPSETLRAQMLYERLIAAHYDDDTAKARIWYDRLIGTFPKSELATYARRGYDPDRLVRKGAQLPDFSVASIDGTGRITQASIAGRYTLLDFWASWCVICESEMGNLHDAYAKYGADGLNILSLSLDFSPDQVRKFRAGKWAMPWQNGFVEKGFGSALADTFGVQTLPKPILVDPNGKIVAIDTELRGARLDQTLSKYLGDHELGNR